MLYIHQLIKIDVFMAQNLVKKAKIKVMKTLLLIFLFITVYAQSKDIKVIQKEIVRSLHVNPGTQLNIHNHNGDLNFDIWQKNEVEIRVVIEVESPKVKHLKRYIEAISIIDKKEEDKHVFVSKVDFSMLDMSFKNGKSTYRIHYFIKHPVYLNVNLYNKNGNIILDETSGNIYINLSNGQLHVNNITTDDSKLLPHIVLNNAKGFIKKTNFLDADLNYSKLIVHEAKSINLNSNYSKVEVESSYIIKTRSNYDKYSINNVSKINLISNYSDFDFSQIIYQADFYAKNGNITIKKIPVEFVEGTFDFSYLNLNMRVSYETCIKLNSSVTYSDIILPKRSNVDNYITLKNKKTTGTIGCISGASSKINIRAEFSNIVISE